MKILIATDKTQGKRANDFNFCYPAEIVTFSPVECDREDVDGECGCKRSMSGIQSQRATTTMEVLEVSMTKKDLCELFQICYEKAGWGKLLGPEAIEKLSQEQVIKLTTACRELYKGAIVERRGEKFKVRG